MRGRSVTSDESNEPVPGASSEASEQPSLRRSWAFWLALDWAILLVAVCVCLAIGRGGILDALDLRSLFR